MGEGEIVQFPAPQLGADGAPVDWTVEIKAQQLRLRPLPQARLPRLLPLLGAAMPALALHLLAQVVLQLQGQPRLATGKPLGHLLQVVAAHGALGQLAQQRHQGGHRLLKLIHPGQIAAGQHLINLPIEPEGRLLQQRPVIAGPSLLQELIGVLAGRQVQHPQLQLPLEGQLLHRPDRPLGGAHAGAIAIEIEDQPLAIAAAT